jgi:type II secretory pathway pseudopilin PulG
LSSAILYVAIVAIWAIVLIPRWLKRDSSAEAAAKAAAAAEAAAAQDTPAAEEQPLEPPPVVREDDTPRIREPGRRSAPPDRPRVPSDRPRGSQDRPRGSSDRPRRPEDRPPRGAEDRPRRLEDRAAGARDGREDGRTEEVRRGRDQDRARVVSARRRMLGLLVVLTTGACALAATRTAASWVVAPPAVMLVGYLGLLREASKADAERRELTAPGRLTRPPRAGPRLPPGRPLPRRPSPTRRSLSYPGHGRPRSRPVRSSTTSTRTPSCARSATSPYRVRTVRTCGPRNEMLGWKVNCWSGASRRAG